MRSFARGFVATSTSWPTLVLVASLTLLTLYGTVDGWTDTDAGAWIVLLGSLSSSQSIIVLGLLWWIFILMRIASWRADELVLVRHGSRLRSLRVGLAEAVGALAAGGVLLAIPTVATAPWDWSVHWQVPGAFVPLQQLFTSPLTALVAVAAYAASAFLLVAVVGLSVALVLGVSWARTVLGVLYVWSALSAFGLTAGLAPLDVSRVFTLVWAITTNAGSYPQVLGGLAAAASVLLVIAADRRLYVGGIGSLSAGHWLWAPVGLALVFSLTSFSGDSAQPAAVAVVGFFAGQYADLVTYCATMLPVLVAATVAIAPAAVSADGRYIEEASRWGSAPRWLLRHLRGALVRSAVAAAGIASVVMLTAIAVLLESPSTSLLTTTAVIAGRVFVQIALYAVVGLALLWFAPIAGAWAICVVVALALGYPLIVPLGSFNVFAAYSTNPVEGAVTFDHVPILTASLVLVVVVATALIGAARARSPIRNLNETVA